MKLKLKGLHIGNSEWISFILTLIATLVGVLIAITLTNSGIRNKEKDDTIKLLHTAKLILTNTNQYAKSLNNTVIELEKDTITNNNQTIEELKSSNPIPYPDLLETIISNELISKNISEFSHNYIYSGLNNLRKLTKYETVEYYQKSLEEMILLLGLEIENQKGEIDSQEFESKFDIGKKKIETKYSKNNILEIQTE
jgi:hypothetical protein